MDKNVRNLKIYYFYWEKCDLDKKKITIKI